MKTITKDELASKLGSQDLVVVNVLQANAYDRIRIKGSISIPVTALVGGRWTELDRADRIVVYCSSYTCKASKEAADFLDSKGFDVSAYEGGITEWVDAGLPTEGKAAARLSKSPAVFR